MHPGEIFGYLRQQPFRPFRLHLTDGTAFEVRHPEMAFASMTHVIVATMRGPHDIPAETVMIAPEHVTRIELLNGVESKGASRTSEAES